LLVANIEIIFSFSLFSLSTSEFDKVSLEMLKDMLQKTIIPSIIFNLLSLFEQFIYFKNTAHLPQDDIIEVSEVWETFLALHFYTH
jgi:hypothetical protein